MEQEDLSLLVQRELLQVQRIVVLKDIQDMKNDDRDSDRSPANSPKPKVKVPDHRDVVAKWMNEAVLFGLGLTNSNDHSKSSQGPRLFTLAASMMDLFLMKCKIKLTQLQLLGSACLSLAAKTRRIQLEEASLIECSDYTITKEEIQVCIFNTIRGNMCDLCRPINFSLIFLQNIYGIHALKFVVQIMQYK